MQYDLRTELRKIAATHPQDALERALNTQHTLNSTSLEERTLAFATMWHQYWEFEFRPGSNIDAYTLRGLLSNYGLDEWSDYLIRHAALGVIVRFENAESLAMARLAINEV